MRGFFTLNSFLLLTLMLTACQGVPNQLAHGTVMDVGRSSMVINDDAGNLVLLTLNDAERRNIKDKVKKGDRVRLIGTEVPPRPGEDPKEAEGRVRMQAVVLEDGTRLPLGRAAQ